MRTWVTFEPPYSTENEVRRALEHLGAQVQAVQEGSIVEVSELVRQLKAGDDLPDFVLWTRTKSLAARVGLHLQQQIVDWARHHGRVTVGYHLDRWWGLPRESDITPIEPFFHVDLLCTADGGHDDEWLDAGIIHEWFPPAISAKWAHRGMFRDEYACDVAFVGNWRDYHPEWEHRMQLVEHLQGTWGSRVKFFPEPGRHAIRGDDLCDLYASAKVVVGDSCLIPARDGSPITNYCSDRIPETIGRGGMLVHPYVHGITDDLWLDGEHLFCWPLGNFDDLDDTIDLLLGDDALREDLSREGMKHTALLHTYESRMMGLVATLHERGLIEFPP